MHAGQPMYGCLQLSRREWFVALAVIATPKTVTAAGFHLTGTLTATDLEAQEGHFAFCGEAGTCHPIDALVISARPQSPLLPHLRAMRGTRVQFSLFPVK
mgnify:CR=1 FL=1